MPEFLFMFERYFILQNVVHLKDDISLKDLDESIKSKKSTQIVFVQEKTANYPVYRTNHFPTKNGG